MMPYLWLVLGLVLLAYGLWSALLGGGGITAWVLALAGAANIFVSMGQIRKGRDG